MARDIEDFLRKAAERRAAQQKGGGGQKPPQQPQRRSRPLEPIIIEDEIEIVELEPEPVKRQSLKNKLEGRENAELKRKADMRTESVSEHVKNHIDSGRLTEKSRHLGERIASVHDQVEARVHKHLDHDISKVDDTPTITDQASPAIVGGHGGELPEQLRKMLNDPNQVGKAILLSEILKRPDYD